MQIQISIKADGNTGQPGVMQMWVAVDSQLYENISHSQLSSANKLA